jgi:hypothetical protein
MVMLHLYLDVWFWFPLQPILMKRHVQACCQVHARPQQFRIGDSGDILGEPL